MHKASSFPLMWPTHPQSQYFEKKVQTKINSPSIPACLVKMLTWIWPHHVYYNLRQCILCSDKSIILVPAYHNLAHPIKSWHEINTCCGQYIDTAPVARIRFPSKVLTICILSHFQPLSVAEQYLGHNVDNIAQFLPWHSLLFKLRCNMHSVTCAGQHLSILYWIQPWIQDGPYLLV